MCGGCPLIHLPYEDQLLAKREAVRVALGRHRDLTAIEVREALAAEPITAYRTRAKLVFGPAGLGLYAKGRYPTPGNQSTCRRLRGSDLTVLPRVLGLVGGVSSGMPLSGIASP